MAPRGGRRCPRGSRGAAAAVVSSLAGSAAPRFAAAAGNPSCWQGPFTFELCCGSSHGPGGNTACWDEVYNHAFCCQGGSAPSAAAPARAALVDADAGAEAAGRLSEAPASSAECWHGDFNEEFCCSDVYGPEGNSECWDEVYTYARCCEAAPATASSALAAPQQGGGSDTVRAGGCAAPYFVRFREAVVDYYETGALGFDIIKSFGRLASDFSEYFEVCAPAVLQALLLQQEERGSLDPPEVRLDLRTKYTLRLQQAMTLGRLQSEDNERWPLKRGLERVHELDRSRSAALALLRPSPARPRSRDFAAAPNVTLVVAYCREPLDWMRTSLGRALIPHLSLAIVRKCPGVDVRRKVPLWRLWRSIDVVDVEDAPLIADECSAYFGYLAQRHAALPEYMFFIHGDAPEHIGALERPNFLDDSLRAVLNGVAIPFLHLSSNRVTMGWDPLTMKVLWRGLFGDSLVPERGEVKTYCCAHFVVSRERALLRTRDWYRRATQFVMSADSYLYLPHGPGPRIGRALMPGAADIACNLPCQNMMFLWHIVFGEDHFQPHRMFDARLPLFARLRNIRLAYLESGGPKV
eukprot:TRINITY_DN20710_c0_g1_i1.p1 TRINITY_DN20710_c0_g1~~TRINITY_DN20710_c0_g1_i1.p1  ORF type:complete len:580 (+),score=134.64 TRINITY_DN20710_c0_g1_i1:112-1851(+)